MQEKQKMSQRHVLPVLDHAVSHCFSVILQQKAVGKTHSLYERWGRIWTELENTQRVIFLVYFHPSLPKVIPVFKRTQDYPCLAWKWEAPVFERGVAARRTWDSHNNGKTTVWWSDGEAKEMDLSGGHSLTLGFFLHLRKESNLNAFSCPVVSILI